MLKRYSIGIDSGTQGSKAVILDWDSRLIISEAYSPHELITYPDGGMEQDPAWWITACQEVIEKALADSRIDRMLVGAIGVSGQQHGFVPLDKKGEVIRPAKLWCDMATIEQCEQITEKLGGTDQVILKTGNAVAASFTASKILWLKEREPEQYAKLDKLLLPHDYINYWLTGEKKTDFGDASGTAYFDVRTRTWSQEILKAIDPSGKLTSCLPELITSEEPVGLIRPEIANIFGLSNNVWVASGSGDNMMAAIGTGNVTDGVLTTSLGTSGTIYAHSSSPVIDPNGELAAFCSATGAWLPLICTMNVTVSTELTRKLLQINIQQLNELAAQAPVGSEGIILLPYFNSERTPALPGATASLFGLNSRNYNPANLSRSAMEGATFGLKYGLEVLKKHGIENKEIRLVGGGAKSSLWRQIVADIMDCSIVCPLVDEAGAFGAALQAKWCFDLQNGNKTNLSEITNEYVELDDKKRTEPQKENVEKYLDVFDSYQNLNRLVYNC